MANPTPADWYEAETPAGELAERIMSEWTTKPGQFRTRLLATLTAYFAQESADRREYARKVHTAPGHDYHYQSDTDTFHSHPRSDCSTQYCGRFAG